MKTVAVKVQSMFRDNTGKLHHTLWGGCEEVPVIFLYSRISNHGRGVSYSRKPEKSSRTRSAMNYYLVITEDANREAIGRELNRAATYFSKRDGVLLGALVELRKLGTLATHEA